MDTRALKTRELVRLTVKDEKNKQAETGTSFNEDLVSSSEVASKQRPPRKYEHTDFFQKPDCPIPSFFDALGLASFLFPIALAFYTFVLESIVEHHCFKSRIEIEF